MGEGLHILMCATDWDYFRVGGSGRHFMNTASEDKCLGITHGHIVHEWWQNAANNSDLLAYWQHWGKLGKTHTCNTH